jgi:hypothetical protein
MYYDDPILIERREAIRLAKLPKVKTTGLLGSLAMPSMSLKSLKSSITSNLAAPLAAITRNGTLALTLARSQKVIPASIFACGATGVPGESDMSMEEEREDLQSATNKARS